MVARNLRFRGLTPAALVVTQARGRGFVWESHTPLIVEACSNGC